MSARGSCFNDSRNKLLMLLQQKLWYTIRRKTTLNFWFVSFRKMVNVENCEINLSILTMFEKNFDFKVLFIPEHYISVFNIVFLASPQHASVKLHCLALTLECENFQRDWEQLFDKCHSWKFHFPKVTRNTENCWWKFRIYFADAKLETSEVAFGIKCAALNAARVKKYQEGRKNNNIGRALAGHHRTCFREIA